MNNEVILEFKRSDGILGICVTHYIIYLATLLCFNVSSSIRSISGYQ